MKKYIVILLCHSCIVQGQEDRLGMNNYHGFYNKLVNIINNLDSEGVTLLELDKKSPKIATVSKATFGKTASGKEIDIYTCVNINGLVLKIMTYGAIVVSVEIPDRDGKLSNVNLGFESLDSYLAGHPYFGATIGRYCNRISKGKFSLNGKKYTLATNDGSNHLHGGEKGFDKVVWDARSFVDKSGAGIEFNYRSPNGEEGYPGNLEVSVVYTLTNNNELMVEFSATSDMPTPVNLTNHNYWNLGGVGSGNILNHELTIVANQYLDVNNNLIPTGKLLDVKGTPFDFTTPKTVGEHIKSIPKIEGLPQGYDHCFVLPDESKNLKFAARVKDSVSGRSMEIYTTQPGIQFYSGNFLDGKPESGGYKQYDGFCLETQHFPDAPNQPKFLSTILIPGEKYNHLTIHRFFNE